jgi:outer membrane protein
MILKYIISLILTLFCTTANAEVENIVEDSNIKEIENSGTNEVPSELSLASTLNLAAERNIDLSRALTSVAKQEARVIEARGELLPEISVNGNTSWLDEGRRFTFQGGEKPNSNTWQGNVQLDQPIFRGGKGLAGKSVEDSLLEAIKHQYQGVRNEVAYQVYQSYFKVLLARELLKVREEAVRLLEDELSKIQKRYEVGVISNFEVIQAEVALANSKTPLIQAQNSLVISLEELKQVLNLDLDREILGPRIKDSLIQSWETISLNDALKQAKENNPEILRLTHVQKASESGIRYERADFLPALSLTVNYGVERTAFINQNFEGWQTGLNLKWKIFDSFKTSSRVEQAQQSFKDANLALKQAVLNTDIGTRRSVASVQEARELVLVSTKAIKQAEEGFRLASNRLEVGSATQLDVLAQRLALTEARSNHAQSLFSQNIAEASLRRIMGVLEKKLGSSEEVKQQVLSSGEIAQQGS